MHLVVDMNILFSFFKADSLMRKLLTNPSLELYSPYRALDEILEHSNEIMSKAKLKPEYFETIKNALFLHVELVPIQEFIDLMEKAESVSPDEEDTAYFALALKHKCPIWSDDKRLKKQSIVRVYNTSEIIRLLELLI